MKKLLSLKEQGFETEKFSVEFLQEAVEFLEELDEKTRTKIIYNITKAQRTRDSVLLKKLVGEIWEFRTLYNRTCYRLFAFWDKTDSANTLIIATHGIVKKVSQTPAHDLLKANRVRIIYFNGK